MRHDRNPTRLIQALALAALAACGGSDGPSGPSSESVSDLGTVGTLTLSRVDPTTLETLEVAGQVRNVGTGGTGSGFRVALLANSVEVGTASVGALAAGQSADVAFTLTDLPAGATQLRMVVDADEQISEGSETNNSVIRNIAVLEQSALTPAATVSALAGATDNELLFRLDLPPDAEPPLIIELSGGGGDVDLFVNAGTRPAARDDYATCQSGTPTTQERCQLSTLTNDTYHVLLHAFSTYSGVTMAITLGGEVLPYDIELVFVSHGTPEQDAMMEQAAARWMELVVEDIPDFDFSTGPIEANQCITGQPRVDGVVDDVVIYVSFEDIDGVSGTLAQAGACTTRGLTNHAILGTMRFDNADLAQLGDDLYDVGLHEMGHVLGIGTIWATRGFLQIPSVPDSTPGVDTHFNGPLAIAAFDAAGGTSYVAGAKVPVANLANPGSADAHWRESVLRSELMTPNYSGAQDNPLSAISVQSLADLGYVVDASRADPFSGSFLQLARSQAPPAPVFDLSDDIRRGPVYVYDQKGRLLEVIR